MARLPASIRARLRVIRLLRPLERRDFALLFFPGVRDPERRRGAAPAAVVEAG